MSTREKNSDVKQVKVRFIETVTTANYQRTKFRDLPINRELKETNINRLINAFKDVNPLGISVLTVIRTKVWGDLEENWNGEAIDYLCDGHNRREAALRYSEEMGCDVPLVFNIIEIDGDDTIETVGRVLQTINVNIGGWTPSDFKDHNAKLGLGAYQEFIELQKEYGLGDTDLLSILGLGQCSMKNFKSKHFEFPNKKKSIAILDVIKKIGFNVPKENKYNAIPHTHVKRTFIKKLIPMDVADIKSSTTKIKAWIKENGQFDYDEKTFRKQLDEILDTVTEDVEA